MKTSETSKDRVTITIFIPVSSEFKLPAMLQNDLNCFVYFQQSVAKTQQYTKIPC